MKAGTYRREDDGSLTLLEEQCSHPWGIGTYSVPEWGELGASIYGYPFGVDPHDFFPDPECCTTEELAAHAAAEMVCGCGR